GDDRVRVEEEPSGPAGVGAPLARERRLGQQDSTEDERRAPHRERRNRYHGAPDSVHLPPSGTGSVPVDVPEAGHRRRQLQVAAEALEARPVGELLHDQVDELRERPLSRVSDLEPAAATALLAAHVDAHAAQSGTCVGRWAAGASSGGERNVGGERQPHEEPGAASDLALDADGATELIEQPTDDVEPEPGAAVGARVRAVRLAEHVEDD